MYVFVYGTLKANFPNHYLVANAQNGKAKFITNGETVDKYPMVITCVLKIPAIINEKGRGHHVKGEIWDVDDKMLATLDRFEGCPELYDREVISIVKPDNEKLECGCYIIKDYNQDLLQQEFFPAYEEKHFEKYKPPNKRSKDDFKYNLFQVLKKQELHKL